MLVECLLEAVPLLVGGGGAKAEGPSVRQEQKSSLSSLRLVAGGAGGWRGGGCESELGPPWPPPVQHSTAARCMCRTLPLSTDLTGHPQAAACRLAHRRLAATPSCRCRLPLPPPQVDVIFLLAWVFFVFGIVALNLFMGAMHKRCAAPGPPDTLVVLPNGTSASVPSGLVFLDDNQPCGRNGGPGLNQCPAGVLRCAQNVRLLHIHTHMRRE